MRKEIHLLDKKSEVFLDSRIGESLGEDFVEDLIRFGFNKINLATGKSAEEVKEIDGLNSIIGKAFPY